MKKFLARAGQNEAGEPKLEMNDYTAKLFRQFLRDNQGTRIQVTPMTPESNKMRRFYMGAVIPLWAYLDGADYRDHNVLKDYFELAKIEFNGKLIEAAGKAVRIGQSTKGAALKEVTEKTIDFLIEQYGIDPMKVLNVEEYKRFRDTIFSHTKIDSYIDYMIKSGILKQI